MTRLSLPRPGSGDPVVPGGIGRAATVVATLLVLGTIAWAGVLQRVSPDLYLSGVQEDEWLEWASFWAFAGAAAVQGIAASRARSEGTPLGWWPLALAAFCAFVALEEVSWGQRVFGYRPPEYFLEHNYQQELNLHNVVARSLRQRALEAVILGYGVVLPLLAALPWSRERLARLGVVAPPAGLAPAFALVYVFYRVYPWDFTGEWVEFLLGLGFLMAAGSASPGPGSRTARVLVAFSTTLALGAASAGATRWQRAARPGMVDAARAELEALRRDFDEGSAASRCGLHKRLYTFVQEYHEKGLLRGEFAALTAQGLPEERARYFLDPWNSPYWLRHDCTGSGRPVAFVYSFGPNRLRDSGRRSLNGDDVGAYVGWEAEPAGDARRR